jgi:uncharacterized protein with PIN domain
MRNHHGSGVASLRDAARRVLRRLPRSGWTRRAGPSKVVYSRSGLRPRATDAFLRYAVMSSQTHMWLQNVESVALCPKCGAASLRRSRSEGRIERFRKKYSSKRVFRCHSCEWRGWVDETRLRYPIRENDAGKHFLDIDDDIPDLRDHAISAATGNARPGGARKAERGATTGGAPPAPVPPEAVENPSTPAPPQRGKRLDGRLDLDPALFDEPAGPYSVQSTDPGGSNSHHAALCPKCDARALYRSRHRNAREAARKFLTRKRPYRCHACGWRGWMAVGP